MAFFVFVNLVLDHLRRGEMTLKDLLQAAPTLTGIYSNLFAEPLDNAAPRATIGISYATGGYC